MNDKCKVKILFKGDKKVLFKGDLLEFKKYSDLKDRIIERSQSSKKLSLGNKDKFILVIKDCEFIGLNEIWDSYTFNYLKNIIKNNSNNPKKAIRLYIENAELYPYFDIFDKNNESIESPWLFINKLKTTKEIEMDLKLEKYLKEKF